MATARPGDRATIVREARKRLGLTQVELARLLNVTNVTVNRWENAKSSPSSGTMRRLAELTRIGLPVGTASDHTPASLPRPATSFLGRDQELISVPAALDTHPIVTLTGPGGAGKTRLAIEVALAIADRYLGGVSFVDLAPLADPSLVDETVASVVAPTGDPHLTPLERIAQAVASEPRLIVLDNCEHLVSPVASLVDRLREVVVATAPSILATSRTPLNALGEQVIPVLPLALGEDDDRSPAVQLYLERAAAADPSFSVRTVDRTVVADICCRLDGMPLGIELAAARTSLLTPSQIRDRLNAGVGDLRDATRSSHRHRTLTNAIAWGFDLLPPEQQRLFERLGVFAGGFDLEAVEAVCASPSDELPAIDGIAGLVAQSMVTVETDRSGLRRRYRMLETLRTFARQRLTERGELDELRRRHAVYLLGLVERARSELAGPEQSRWFDLLEADEDNLRAALSFAEHLPESDMLLQFVIGLWRFWSVRGRIGEGRIWTERAIAHPDSGPSPLRADVLNVAGNLANDQGDNAVAYLRYNESLALYRTLGNHAGQIKTLSNLSIISSMQGDYAVSVERLEAALTLARDLGDVRLHANVLHNLAVVEEHRGQLEAAATRYAESRAIFEDLGDTASIATVLNNLGNLARGRDDPTQAMVFYREALARREAIGDAIGIASCLHNLGVALRIVGDVRSAIAHLEASLIRSRELGNQHGAANTLTMLGLIAADDGNETLARSLLAESLLTRERLRERVGMAECFEGLAVTVIATDPERAALLFGVATVERERTDEILEPHAARWRERHLETLHSRIGGLAVERAMERGRAMSTADALELGISTADPTKQQLRRSPGLLSDRQRELLTLVADGKTNAEIATIFGVSKRTVESHLNAVYTRLGVSHRSAAIAYAHRAGIVGLSDSR